MAQSVKASLFVVSLTAALAAAGCSTFGHKPPAAQAVASAQQPVSASAATAQASASTAAGADQIDPRRFLGSGYCPELRILSGAELLRRYERGHNNEPNAIIWQASFGDVARECLYNPDGSLTLKVGVSGRVVAGPKGGPGDITVPIKIAIVKYQEAVLAQQGYDLAVTVPPSGSGTFAQVREMPVPPPGKSHDYIIYVGFDVKDFDPMHPDVASVLTQGQPAPPPEPEGPPVVFDEPAPPPPQQQARPKPQPKKPMGGNTLPVPSDGFVLTQ